MRALRYVAALVALVVFAQTAHWTLVAHSVCAVHGELTHHDAHHDDAGHRGDVAKSSSHQEVAPATADDDHHHCMGVWTEHAVLTDNPPAVALHLDFVEVGSIHRMGIVVARRLWLLAPKTSPPSPLLA